MNFPFRNDGFSHPDASACEGLSNYGFRFVNFLPHTSAGWFLRISIKSLRCASVTGECQLFTALSSF